MTNTNVIGTFYRSVDNTQINIKHLGRSPSISKQTIREMCFLCEYMYKIKIIELHFNNLSDFTK